MITSETQPTMRRYKAVRSWKSAAPLESTMFADWEEEGSGLVVVEATLEGVDADVKMAETKVEVADSEIGSADVSGGYESEGSVIDRIVKSVGAGVGTGKNGVQLGSSDPAGGGMRGKCIQQQEELDTYRSPAEESVMQGHHRMNKTN